MTYPDHHLLIEVEAVKHRFDDKYLVSRLCKTFSASPDPWMEYIRFQMCYVLRSIVLKNCVSTIYHLPLDSIETKPGPAWYKLWLRKATMWWWGSRACMVSNLLKKVCQSPSLTLFANKFIKMKRLSHILYHLAVCDFRSWVGSFPRSSLPRCIIVLYQNAS